MRFLKGEKGPKFLDRTGERYGRLLVVGLAQTNPVKWECLCACGGSRQALSADLSTKIVQSCGCLQKESGQRMGWARRLRPFESLYNGLVYEAHKRGVPISLTFEEFVLFTESKECHYCGAKVEWFPYMKLEIGPRTNLDRKDNSLGYTKDNCVVCCARCNLARGNRFTHEEWLEIGKVIRTFKKAVGATA